MRRFFLLVLFSATCHAETVRLEFDKVPVIEFVQVIYNGVLRQNYVVSPEVVMLDKTVSMKMSVEEKAIPSVISAILLRSGLATLEEAGVIYIDFAKEPELPSILERDVIEVYKPRHRSADYLKAALSVVGHGNSGIVLGGQKTNVGVPAAASSFAGDFILLNGSQGYIDKALDFLQKIDSKPSSIQIRAALVEVTKTEDEAWNLGLVLSQKLGLVLGSSSPVGNVLKFASKSLDLFVSAISGDNKYKLITQPRIVVSDGKPGKISVGSEVPVRGAVTYDDAGKALQSIEYRSSGVILDVVPRIYQDYIQLDVSQQVSSFAETTTSGIDSPTLIKRELVTTLDIKEGELVAMAGLDEEKESDSRGGLGFFRWFSSNQSINKTELILLLEVSRM